MKNDLISGISLVIALSLTLMTFRNQEEIEYLKNNQDQILEILETSNVVDSLQNTRIKAFEYTMIENFKSRNK